MQDKATFDKFLSERGFPEIGYRVNPTLPCGATEDCPVGLVCDYSGGRRLRFGAAKTGVCVDLRTWARGRRDTGKTSLPTTTPPVTPKVHI